MTIIIFLIILSVLVIVHELGHFLVARSFNIGVDEFGLGYPPRAKKLFTRWGTLFTLNWLPFGGFVKIDGENSTFRDKSKWAQTAVLSAGSVFNLIFAWLVISLGLVWGLPAPEGINLPVKDLETTVISVLPHSPADLAGLKSGDVILAVNNRKLDPAAVSHIISQSVSPLTFDIDRGGELIRKEILASEEIVPGERLIGVSMDSIGVAQLSPLSAIWHGARVTAELTYETALALKDFFLSAFSGGASFSQVTGPVGLVGVVGEASGLGLGHLLSLVALISINLGLINLFPIPALDGGRIAFVAIEAVWGRKIPEHIFNLVNNVSFTLLLLLMLMVTFHDVKVWVE